MAKTLCRWLWLALMLVWATASADVTKQAVIAVIVAQNAPGQALDKKALDHIFLRKTTLWANGETIRPVNLSGTHPVRRLFSERVVGLEPEELEDYWNDQYFHGVFPPYAVDSEEAAIRYVSESAAAIGYVSACAVDRRVKVLLYLTPAGFAQGGNTSHYCPQH